jgi:hypothetical protein
VDDPQIAATGGDPSPLKNSPNKSDKSAASHQKTLSHPNKMISLNKMHLRNDSAPMLEAPENFL